MKNEVITFEILGKEYELKPTFKAAVAIESAMGKEASVLIQQIGDRRYGVTNCARILYEALKANGAKVTLEDVGEEVAKDAMGANGKVLLFLMAYFASPDTETTGDSEKN